ncbi:MAG: aminoacyl-tRNA hydrolase [Candidatus Doudnabacteria bacterium]|nr:aminoacyl-tRNA hydrolase [Candidatus Doudnabacteria bacterium]
MYIIVGLGNPGNKYEETRHNFGFRVLDMLAGSNNWEKKYDSEFIKLEDVVLAKPQLFMNKSGEAVSQIVKFYPDAELIVVHDELDLPLGSIKIQKNVTSAGHNGVQSIIDALGTKEFIRIRLGIDNPQTRGEVPGDAYVLQKFTSEEENIVKEVLEKAKDGVETIQTQGLDIAQSRFNG